MTCYGKLTSSVSQDTNSAKKSSKNATVAQLDDQTCPPPIPDFSWRPFSHLDLFSKWNHICGSCFFQFLILPGCYFHQLDLFTKSYCICGSSFFLFVTKAILIMPGKQMHSTYFLSLAATDTMWIFSLFRHHLSLKIIWKYVPPGSWADDQEEVVTIIQEVQLFSCWKSPCSTWFT